MEYYLPVDDLELIESVFWRRFARKGETSAPSSRTHPRWNDSIAFGAGWHGTQSDLGLTLRPELSLPMNPLQPLPPNARRLVLWVLSVLLTVLVVFEVVRQTPHYTYEAEARMDELQAQRAAEAEFSIFTCTLEGKDLRELVHDPTRQLTHARVSPDKQWVAFTRFNSIGNGGLALEYEGYLETEIMRMRIDGSDIETIVPPVRGLANFNSNWTPDGGGLLYASDVNDEIRTRVHAIDLESRQIRVVRPDPSIPNALAMADPHARGDRMVFSVQFANALDRLSHLWTMGLDGSAPEPLTHPIISSIPDVVAEQGGGGNPIKRLLDYRRSIKTSFQSSRMISASRTPTDKNIIGDYEPKMSPDGTQVAFMRRFAEHNYHLMIVDVESGEERDLSAGLTADVTPEWSSDGKLLIFWHVDGFGAENTEVWTVAPDGSDRKRVPLPKGLIPERPAFFPGEGSGPDARIIFSASRAPPR